MAISGSIEIYGLEVPESYTRIKSFTYTNIGDEYNINCEYETFVDLNHRNLGMEPLQSNRTVFTIVPSGSVDLFDHIYSNIKNQKYFISSSLTNC